MSLKDLDAIAARFSGEALRAIRHALVLNDNIAAFADDLRSTVAKDGLVKTKDFYDVLSKRLRSYNVDIEEVNSYRKSTGQLKRNDKPVPTFEEWRVQNSSAGRSDTELEEERKKKGKQAATTSTERTAATALPQVSVQGILPVPNNLVDVPIDADIPTTWKFDYNQTFTMFRPVTPEIEGILQRSTAFLTENVADAERPLQQLVRNCERPALPLAFTVRDDMPNALGIHLPLEAQSVQSLPEHAAQRWALAYGFPPTTAENTVDMWIQQHGLHGPLFPKKQHVITETRPWPILAPARLDDDSFAEWDHGKVYSGSGMPTSTRAVDNAIYIVCAVLSQALGKKKGDYKLFLSNADSGVARRILYHVANNAANVGVIWSVIHFFTHNHMAFTVRFKLLNVHRDGFFEEVNNGGRHRDGWTVDAYQERSLWHTALQAGFSAHPYFGNDEAIVATVVALDVEQTLPRYLWVSFAADAGTRLPPIPSLDQTFNIVVRDKNGLPRFATVTWVSTILAEPESPDPVILGLSRTRKNKVQVFCPRVKSIHRKEMNAKQAMDRIGKENVGLSIAAAMFRRTSDDGLVSQRGGGKLQKRNRPAQPTGRPPPLKQKLETMFKPRHGSHESPSSGSHTLTSSPEKGNQG
ncbi:hypothetical protein DIS24_g6046 [Lasiodiplodia hormozganensis]|uniref:Uncharacterized protein n=1 Tax=Lasiodiplodia hormozganensis TaxID=869390 RepID=A0AA39YJ00_9PEZI|nr:hypothetical protein DIS24_g6046 [Lasiodiplodia hormozganensis]